MAFPGNSKVYFAKAESNESPEKISKKIGALIKKSGIFDFIRKDDFIGVKIHFGEDKNTGHIKSCWLKEVARQIIPITKNAFLTDTNVLYKNSRRTNSVDHLKLAYEHGFSLEKTSLPVIIADGLTGRNFVEVPVNKFFFNTVKIASDIARCDGLIVMTHITGHMQTGFGGTLKNLGMGCAARRGKYEQHSGIVPSLEVKYCIGCGACAASCPAACISLKNKKAAISEKDCIGCGECAVVCRTRAINVRWSEKLENLQKKMVEYAYGALRAVGNRAGYVSFLTNITKDCDCMAKDDPSIVHDIGILASSDPVSIDKAATDLVIKHAGIDIFRQGYPETDWSVQLGYASQIGLGNLDYRLEEI